MTQKFVIDNHTHWATRDLRRFLQIGLVEKGVIDQADSYGWTFSIKYGRSRGRVGGVAFPRSFKIQLNLPKRAIPLKELAQVFEHEVDHMLGLHHSEMAPWWELEVPWIEDLIINKSKPKRKLTRQERSDKAEVRCRKLLAAWEQKLKRAERKVKGYRKKVQYSDRKKSKEE